MIIGIDIREWQPGIRTGIGRFLEEFLRIATHARPRDRFLLVGDSTCEVRVQSSNVEVIRYPERCGAWWDQVVLPKALARGGADVLYSPYLKLPLLASVPVVSTIHDLTFFRHDNPNRRVVERLLIWSFRLFCWFVVRRAAAIIVDSETTSRDVQHLLGADPARIRVIPLATSPFFQSDADRHTDERIWARYRLKPGYVLYVGNFLPHKNVPRLVEAYRQLPSRVRQTHPLVLVGGPFDPEQGRCVSDSHEGGTVRYLGVVPEEDLPALYRGAVLFAFPSFYEGFGLPVLEAMACGLPVLCSTAPALAELAGQAAEYADPNDEKAWQAALAALLESPARRAELAARSRLKAKAYSPEQMTAEIFKVLDDVVTSDPA